MVKRMINRKRIAMMITTKKMMRNIKKISRHQNRTKKIKIVIMEMRMTS